MNQVDQLKQELSLAYDANAALEQAILDKNKYIAALEKRIDDLKEQLSNERMRNPPPLTLKQSERIEANCPATGEAHNWRTLASGFVCCADCGKTA